MVESTVPTRSERGEAPTTHEETQRVAPPVDIYETEDGLTVLADLPGVDKDAIDISVEDNILTIQGRTSHSVQGDPLRREFELRDYYRQFRLGDQVDQENIGADLKNGVLTLRLPKAEKAKPKRIAVNMN